MQVRDQRCLELIGTGACPLAVTGGFRTVEGMANAITSGAVDVVGIARSLAIEPDVPNKLLRGEKAKYPLKPLKTGIPIIDKMGLMEVSWYSLQLRRIGRGEQPKPNENALWAFLKIAIHQLGITKRLPGKLRAS